MARDRRRRRDRREEKQGPELDERVVQVNRVAKVQQGGRRFRFSALVVVGDNQGRVGVALGKAPQVPDAIRKASEKARRNMIQVPLVGTTIPHDVVADFKATRVILRPAAPGTGVIAGGAVRPVLEAAGIRDVLAKILGSSNPINAAQATIKALQMLRSVEETAEARGLSLEEVRRRRFRLRPKEE